MYHYIAAQVRHTQRDPETDATKRVSDTYFQRAYSVVEAVAALTTHLAPELTEMEIGPTKPVNASDVLRAPSPENENATWFEARIEVDGATEDNPRARPAKQLVLIEARDWAGAVVRLQEETAKWLVAPKVISLKAATMRDVLEVPEVAASAPVATT